MSTGIELDNKFYVYGLFVPKSSTKLDNCIYIGKGKDDRLNVHFEKSSINRKPNSSKNKLIRNENVYSRKIVYELSESKAFEVEQYFISELGLENLTNERVGKYGKVKSESEKEDIAIKRSGWSKSEAAHAKWLAKNTDASQSKIAKYFGVDQPHISWLNTGRVLSFVEPEKPPKDIVSKFANETKLKKHHVAEIKWLIENTNMMHTEIAKRYPVTAGNITHIKKENTWKWVNSSKPNEHE